MTNDLFYAWVATTSNDFSLTEDSAPFLLGFNSSSATQTVEYPSTATQSTLGSFTASASDGTTGTVTVVGVTNADGRFIVRESET